MGTEVARDGVPPLPGNVDLPNVCDQSREFMDEITDETRWISGVRAHLRCAARARKIA